MTKKELFESRAKIYLPDFDLKEFIRLSPELYQAIVASMIDWNRLQIKSKKSIPVYGEFLEFALEKTPDGKVLDEPKFNLKYEAWVENGWKDGKNKKILNWRSKLLQTLPYLWLDETNKNKKLSASEILRKRHGY